MTRIIPFARSNTRDIQKMGQKNETGYRFINKDPIMDQVVNLIDSSSMSKKEISYRSGVSTATFQKWKKGDTKRPQNASIDVVLRTLGYHRPIVPIRKGK